MCRIFAIIIIASMAIFPDKWSEMYRLREELRVKMDRRYPHYRWCVLGLFVPVLFVNIIGMKVFMALMASLAIYGIYLTIKCAMENSNDPPHVLTRRKRKIKQGVRWGNTQ